ncbi:unnamed protein product [Fusarium graminearum]|uniref:Uncharacterized protein n=1 Tax=Gibberella zeae TaxID=5518 RepID=A0A4E9EH68_GIBZA|nr:unnamed protein product [Fusarium graminearum]
MSLLLLLLAGIKGGGWFYGRAARAPIEVKDVSFVQIALSGWQAPSSFTALAGLQVMAFLPSPGAAWLPPTIPPSETKGMLERWPLHPRLRYLCQSANCRARTTQLHGVKSLTADPPNLLLGSRLFHWQGKVLGDSRASLETHLLVARGLCARIESSCWMSGVWISTAGGFSSPT